MMVQIVSGAVRGRSRFVVVIGMRTEIDHVAMRCAVIR